MNDRVTISGLEENKQFNGLKGIVKGTRKGRFEVLVDDVNIKLLLRPKHIGASNDLWMPVERPTLTRQKSFEQVKLVQEQSFQLRKSAKKFINLLSKPFEDLTYTDDSVKYALFLQEGKEGKGGEQRYLMSTLPPSVLKLPLHALVLVIDYSEFRIARLSMEKRGRDLMNFINVRRKLSINSGASLQQLTAEKLLQEKVRTKLRQSFGNISKPDESEVETTQKEGEWEWEWEDEYSDDEDEGEDGVDPSDTSAKTKEVIPSGLCFLELGILMECLAYFYPEVSGNTWKEDDNIAEVVDVTSGTAKKKEAKPVLQGKGYTGQQGETKDIARKIELKKLEDLVRDQVSGVMFGAVCISLNELLTSQKLDSEHINLLARSCLNPLLGVYLRNTFMQISERQQLYLSILKTVEVLATDQRLCSLLFRSEPRQADLMPILLGLKQQIELFLKSPLKGGDKETVELIASAQEFDRILATVALQGKTFLKAKMKAEKEANEGKSTKPLSQKEKDDIERKSYLGRMRALAIDFVDLQNSPTKHIFLKESKSSPPTAKLCARLTKEIGSMMSGLPPGIFVRVDQTKMNLMRICMTGPEGSPYQNGMFFFDVYFPYNYPAVPPKMKIITTGRATFRFNANLYTNGKVCLSLLGTWQGPGWEPSYSTLLQVLISIQAMILGIDEPIANEPGWERDRGSTKSKRYNSILSHGTMLFAMYDHLKAPPDGFELPVQLHFSMIKKYLLETQLPKWNEAIKVAGPSDAGPYRKENLIRENIATTYKKLVDALKDLKAPVEAKEEDDDDDESEQDDY